MTNVQALMTIYSSVGSLVGHWALVIGHFAKASMSRCLTTPR